MNIGDIHQELNKALLKIHFPYEKGLLRRETLIHHSGKWLWEKILDFTESKGADFILASSLLDLHPFQSLWNVLLQRGRSRNTWRSLQGELRLRGDWLQINLEGEGEGNTAFPPPWELSHAQWLWLFQEPKLLPRVDNSTFRIQCAVSYATTSQTVLWDGILCSTYLVFNVTPWRNRVKSLRCLLWHIQCSW